MRKSATNKLLDTLHRGVVYSCIGMTLYGSYLLGLRVHRYFTVIKPAKEQAELKMLQEGAHDNTDKAPVLRA